MGEMKLNLSTNFMRNLVSKFVVKAIHKKLGVKPELQINELKVEMIDGKIRFHINIDGVVDEKVFTKISRMIDEE